MKNCIKFRISVWLILVFVVTTTLGILSMEKCMFAWADFAFVGRHVGITLRMGGVRIETRRLNPGSEWRANAGWYNVGIPDRYYSRGPEFPRAPYESAIDWRFVGFQLVVDRPPGPAATDMQVAFPICAPFFIYLSYVLWRAYRSRRTSYWNECFRCDHALMDDQCVCPECGTHVRTSH